MERKTFTLIELLVVVAIVAVLVAVLLPALAHARQQGQASVCLANNRGLGLGCTLYMNDYHDYIPRIVCDVAESGDGWMGRLFPYIGIKDVAIIPPGQWGAFYVLPNVENYKKLQGTVLDCPTVPGPASDPDKPSIDNFWHYNYAMCTTVNLVLARRVMTDPFTKRAYETRFFPRGSDVQHPSETIIIGESNAWWDPPSPIGLYQSAYFRFYTWAMSAPFIDWDRHGDGCEWLFYDGHASQMNHDEFWSPGFYFGHGWVGDLPW